MTTAEFWAAQPFSYIETYSFNRGPRLAALHENLSLAVEQTTGQLQQARFMQRAKLEQKLRGLEEALRGNVPLKMLTGKELTADATAEQVAVIEWKSAMAHELTKVFHVPSREEFASGCAPIYRDALAFYNLQGKLFRVLNICFQCLFMRTDDGLTVEASMGTYEALRRLLTQLGHPIEIAKFPEH